ncbi:EamA family transporter [Achromobacter aloeverae]|uniref:EamA domain-containing protein n=1 Tax=Achromobacter aloeverae TaxID=1750518 RepID=A0A4Q1HIZ3_9BURK|nr:EamA family transporter [Achromobacter aloeverae]RXN86246.1 hypothetical protein C7R54_21230 [Achromobacter aloeverae]
MKLRDLLLAVVVTALWGINFSIIKIGLGAFDPFVLAALRFLFCALPWVFVIKRPRTPFRHVFWYGLVLGVMQFGLLFLAIRLGLSAGMASVVLQLQVFFTIGFGALSLGERIKPRQFAGMLLAFAGVVAVTRTDGAGSTLAIALVVGAAASWGIANIIVKRSGASDMLGFTVWSSLVPPLPLLGIALAISGPARVAADLSNVGWHGALAVGYLVYPTTILGYSAWNYLLRKYPTPLVAPLSLLVPIFGMFGSMLIFHEELTARKLLAAGLVLGGLLINMVGWPVRRGKARVSSAGTFKS